MSDHLSNAFAPLVNDNTIPCISSSPSLCYHYHPIRNTVGVRRVCSFREGVREKGKRDIALGQCMYAEINKQSNTHKLGTALELFGSQKNSPWKLGNKLSFSFLTSFGDSPFFGRMSKFKDTGSLGSLKEEEVEKKAEGCLTVEERRESPGYIKAICLLFAPNSIPVMLRKLSLSLRDQHFKNLRTWKPSSPTWAFNLPWIQKTEKNKDLEKQSQTISCSLIHSDPHLLKLHWWLCSLTALLTKWKGSFLGTGSRHHRGPKQKKKKKRSKSKFNEWN